MNTLLSLRLRGRVRVLLVAAAACFALGESGNACGQDAATPPTLPADANTTCPVMPEEPADPELYVDHEGRRVYLCCTKCKREFKKDPEKYMKLLPPAASDGKTGGATPSTGTNATNGATTRTAQLPSSGSPLPESGSKQSASKTSSAPQISALERAVRYSGRLHAVSVHFPIGLLLGAAAVEALAVVRRRPVGSEGARVPLALGTLGAALAVPLGWINAAFNQNPGLEHYVEWHRWLGTAAGVAALVAWLLARRARSGGVMAEKAYLTALFTGSVLIIVAGHFGATLIYGPDYLKP